jgi:predicted nuclease of predicted toxin-antitoxin system
LRKQRIKFLADESCDFTVVRTLRSADYDVVAVAESLPSTPDVEVLRFAVEEERILLTEDKDFGEWVFAHGEVMSGVVLIRFPADMRSELGKAVTSLVAEHGSNLVKSFTVLEPGRARIRKQK